MIIRLNKKGMTLLELLVGLLLFSILTATASAVFSPIVKTFEAANNLSELNTLFDNLSSEMVSEIGKATQIDISADNKELTINGFITYSVNDGLLCKNGDDSPIFNEQYYKGKTIEVDFNKLDSLITITMTINPSGITRQYAVQPIGIE